jgi:hypothetical protein
MVKDPWIPAPLYSMKEEEEKVEKINEDIPLNNLHIEIGKITCPNLERVHLQLILQYSNDKSINEFINKRPEDIDFKYKNTFNFEKTDYNLLSKKTIKIILIEKQGCCIINYVTMGECNIKLDSLRNVSTVNTEYEFKGTNETSYGKINVNLKLRSPFANKEYISVSKLVLTITKTFPPFVLEGNSKVDKKPQNVNANNSNNKEEKKQIKQEKKKDDNKELKPQENKEVKPQQKKKVEVNENEFKSEELENPDIIDNLVSLKVLEFKIKKCEQESKKIEGRCPPALREKMLKMRVKYKTIESQMSDGIINVDKYISVLKYQIEHDNKLINYFESKKEIEKGKLVAERIKVMISEMEEAIQYAKTQKR